MSQQPDKRYLLIGHVTNDVSPGNAITTGGTVTYGAVIAKQLGWKPAIVTAAGPDFAPPAYLADIDWHIVPSPQTTTFRNTYDAQGNREQTIGPVARPIRAADVPPEWRSASIVHLGPLNKEVPVSLSSILDRSFLVVTPQGWMRQWDQQGAVSRGEWVEADEMLAAINAAVISIEDIGGNWSMAEQWAALCPLLIVTQGAMGCTVFSNGQQQMVPPRPSQPVDLTGAGDVFATAFAIRFKETDNPWRAARFANVTASMAIEREGSEGAPGRDEVERYLAQSTVNL